MSLVCSALFLTRRTVVLASVNRRVRAENGDLGGEENDDMGDKGMRGPTGDSLSTSKEEGESRGLRQGVRTGAGERRGDSSSALASGVMGRAAALSLGELGEMRTAAARAAADCSTTFWLLLQRLIAAGEALGSLF